MTSSEASSQSLEVDADFTLYNDLWRACAGPLVTVPQENELVYYFPQEHIEQVKASTYQVLDKQMPLYDLPSKILCRVVSVQLKAEVDTDEVFAQITLMPEHNQDENLVKKEEELSLQQKFHVHSFSKTLTVSDTSSHARLVVPRKHALECFPQLDMSRERPSQELIAKDLHGNKWRFTHIFRGRPQRHLLQSGWTTFVTAKKLVTGDAFIFLRSENGELGVGVRRAMGHHQHINLQTAWNSIQSGSTFSVDYYPRTSHGEFIIPVDKYMESIKKNYSTEMRSKMRWDIKPITTTPPLIQTQKRHRSKGGFKDMDKQSSSTKSRIKVRKEGSAIGRSLDLTKFNNYDELIGELDELFKFHGELKKNQNKDWVIVYTDTEGDMMLVGDDPWKVFCEVVCKIFIYTREEVERMDATTLNSRGDDSSSIAQDMGEKDTNALVLYKG